MSERKIIRRRGKLPPDKVARLRASRQWVEEHKQEITRGALETKAELDTMLEAIRALKAVRETKGLSLADVSERTGIDKANLSRLENDPNPNPTWATLTRLAAAIGVRLRCVVEAA